MSPLLQRVATHEGVVVLAEGQPPSGPAVTALPSGDAALVGVATGAAIGGTATVVMLSGRRSLDEAQEALVAASQCAQGGGLQAPLVVCVPLGAQDMLDSDRTWPNAAVARDGGVAADLVDVALRKPELSVLMVPRVETAVGVPLAEGTYQVLRQGDHVVLVATGTSVVEALQAASVLEHEGITVEVVDAIRPDSGLLCGYLAQRAAHVGRLVFVHAPREASLLRELQRAVTRSSFWTLESPPTLTGGEQVIDVCRDAAHDRLE